MVTGLDPIVIGSIDKVGTFRKISGVPVIGIPIVLDFQIFDNQNAIVSISVSVIIEREAVPCQVRVNPGYLI